MLVGYKELVGVCYTHGVVDAWGGGGVVHIVMVVVDRLVVCLIEHLPMLGMVWSGGDGRW